MLKGTNLEHARVHNLRTVLETVRLHGPLSRADVAKRSGLTPQTVSNLVSELIARGLVREGGQRQGARGRSPTLLSVRPEGAYSIGLDLDRGHLTGLLIDLSGEVRARVHVERPFPSPEEAMDLVVSAVDELSASVEPRRLWGVGIGFPGPLRISGGAVDNVINPEGFPGWESVSVRSLLARRVTPPVFLENNATAAALGEAFYGVGAGLSSYFYCFLGVGLGGAIVSSGRPVRGWQGNAGELGYMPLHEGGEGDHLGRRFDLFRLYGRLAAKGVRASTYSDLSRLLAAGEPLVLAWLDEAADGLARALVSAEYLLDPEAIVVGGAWEEPLVAALVARLEERLPRLRSPLIPATASLLTAQLGADAVARGVATLPLQELLAPFPTSTDGAAEQRAHPYEHPLVAVR
ncbi:MAG TPA: ROK family transcriptional regulator [Trueperaceae bacterium]|nr:ROK family transcriptional regulator [Trueperaceae bacterium]